jgi:hypothetical protein
VSQKIAKKVRRELKDLKVKLASELKGLISGLPFRKRIILAFRIIMKREW